MEPFKDHKPCFLVPTPLLLANSDSSILLKAGAVVGAEADPLPATPTYLTDLPPDKVDLVHQLINISPDIDSCQSHQSPETPSDGNLLVIPPPTDFRDEPDAQVDFPGVSMPMPRQPLPQSDIVQQLLNRTTSKDEAKSPTATDSDQFHNGNYPPSPFEALPPSLHEFLEPKHSPPAVAPKPKRLPPNIILKTHKGSVSSPLSSPDQSTASCTSPNDRILMDPQKVRMEALRKLGLLKDEEADLSPRPWELSPSPVSPASSDPPENYPPPQTRPKAQSSPTLPPAMEAPVPKLFGEHRDRASSDLPAFTHRSRTVSTGEKSATIERMGSGLSYLSLGQTSTSPGQDKDPPETLVEGSLTKLRNTRPRPASLGNGKDFRDFSNTDTVAAVAKSPEVEDGIRQQNSSSSQKRPRSQGISVLITPRGKSGEDRREALRKLGLLKDWDPPASDTTPSLNWAPAVRTSPVLRDGCAATPFQHRYCCDCHKR